jgi:6-pyruvoyltetrahydropterin/6-carboxytetrahydropterin synthase
MKPTCTRRIQFCAGHRVAGHENKCRNLHGHNYVVFFEAEADELDAVGRVIDFGALKENIGGWIDDNWDHGFILGEEDHQARAVIGGMAGQKQFLLPMNPTAEWMADYLLYEVCPAVLEGTGVIVRKVVLWETENCYATAEIGMRGTQGEEP